MILSLLFACGVDHGLGTPAPPPQPPPELDVATKDTITFLGSVGDLSPATRSWTLTGDGRKMYCILGQEGRIFVGTSDAGMDAMGNGAAVTVEGKKLGDVLIVDHVTLPTPVALPADATPTDPALVPAGGMPVDVPAPAPAAPTPDATSPAAPAPSSPEPATSASP